MKINTTKKAAASLLILYGMLSPSAFAQALDDNVSKLYFDDAIRKCELLLGQWQSDWKIAVGFAALVVILGIVSAGLQSFQFQSVKVTTAICGLVITIVTGLTNTIGWDHRELNRSITKGLSKLAQMNTKKALYGSLATDEDKRVMLTDFGKLYVDFMELQGQPDTLAQAGNFDYSIINTAYAQQEGEVPPPWVHAIPADANNLYFIGIADSTKLDDAKTTSKDNAIQNAANFLAEKLSTTSGTLDIDELTSYLAQTAEDTGNYVSFDKKNNIYRYYSLIRINKSVAEARVSLFAVQRGITPSAGLIKALNDTQRERDDYAAKQLQQYEALLNKTSALLSTDEYRKFSEARELRKQKKDYEKAITMLNEILAQNPEFYMGWYNLALAYASSGNDEAARKTYEKTISLEPSQPLRDGTAYNAYGHFLYDRKQYCEAIPQFEKAVELDPNNPRAQNNLQQTRNRLKEAGIVCH